MKIRGVGICAVLMILLGTQPGRAENSADRITVSSYGQAIELKYSGDPNKLEGLVTVQCTVDGAPLGGYFGSISANPGKGNPSSGSCPSSYLVLGYVRVRGKLQDGCSYKVVDRPRGGWNNSNHAAYFDSVIVKGDKVQCRMGGL
jgi:hypothetical protein